MFSKLHLTTAQTFVLHSLLSILVGGIGAAGTAGLQAVFSNGNFDPKLVVGAGGAAFLAWFAHGFVSLKNSPLVTQAALDTVSEIHLAPALVPDVEEFAKQVAIHLFSMKTPPVASLQPQQRPIQNQPVAQQPVQQSQSYAPVNNPTPVMGGGAPIGISNTNAQWPPQNQQGQAQYWDMNTQRVQNVPPFSGGHGG